jgi:large subunit ribosomal protein L4
MTLDVVNAQNEKVGFVDVSDEVFGGRVKADLIWQQVRHEQAGARRGTHATKNRALVSGSGRKPWRQKGTGRARVGEIRNPLWRKGGTVFGPQPRDYAYALPRKVTRGALRAALTQKIRDGAVTVVDALAFDEVKTKRAAALLAGLGAARKTLVIDVKLDEKFTLSARNLAGVEIRPSSRVTARDVMDAQRVIATRAAVERLQEALAS